MRFLRPIATSNVSRIGRGAYVSQSVDPSLVYHTEPCNGGYLLIWMSGANIVLTPKLYLDYGNGFSEHSAIHLRNVTGKAVYRFPLAAFERLRGLRIDPMEETGAFSLRVVHARTAMAEALLSDKAGSVLQYIKSPKSYARRLSDAAAILDEAHHKGARPVSLASLFDVDWYMRQVSEGGVTDALAHYLETGHTMGLNPHPLIDEKFYKRQLSANDRSMSALQHYIEHGRQDLLALHPLFDTKYYVTTNASAQHAFNQGTDALSHYLSTGDSAGLSPCRAIDIAWYKRNHVDRGVWRRTLAEHIVMRGQARQRIAPEWVYDPQAKTVAHDTRILKDAIEPFVSIIIVNLDGRAHLRGLFESLAAQTYTHYEIIFVDNASNDDSCRIVGQICPIAQIVNLDENVGFAQANNIGLQHSRGELVVLLNNDTRVDANWLDELIATMRRHPRAAIVTSRVRFWERFHEVQITSNQKFALDLGRLNASLSYKKPLINKGMRRDHAVEAEFTEDKSWDIRVKLPATEEHVELCLSADTAVRCRVLVGSQAVDMLDVDPSGMVCELNLPALGVRGAMYVLNNAGSYEPAYMATGDRGFGEFDTGQYGFEGEVALACGCAMMIRRDALHGMPIFVSDFFAYYEDSELSLRVRRNGYQIIFSSSAIVYHRHSSTSVEKSEFWHKHVKRNSALYRYILTAPADRHAYLHSEMMSLNHYYNWLENQPDRTRDEDALRKVLPSVMQELKERCQRVDAGKLLTQDEARVSIYNKWWVTRGGAEAHALFLAEYLAQFFTVELMSDVDFDLVALGKYFGIDTHRYRKRIIKEMVPSVTQDYDIFINTSYMNECPSRARHSFFIVSFPSRTPSKEFLTSYTFLANSGYTTNWIRKYWPDDVKLRLVQPAVAKALAPVEPVGIAKKRVLLSVGRFFADGHSKNQLEIVKAFRTFNENNPDNRWTLKLVGSVTNQTYLTAVEAEADGLSVEIFPNARLEQVRALYREASIYVHASGLHQSSQDEPENFEHFGMTVAEACSNGCLPVVFNVGGPSDIVDTLGFGLKFGDFTELCSAMGDAIYMVDHGRYNAAKIADAGKIFSANSCWKAVEDALEEACLSLIKEYPYTYHKSQTRSSLPSLRLVK